MTGPVVDRGLLQTALVHDRAGELDAAQSAIQRHNVLTVGSLLEQIDGFRVEAKVLRHRHEPASLARAVDAAEWALTLATLPGQSDPLAAALAELELVSCRLASDEFADGRRAALRWTSHENHPVAGWAWALTGEAELGLGNHFGAIAALYNAIAEFRCVGNQFRERTARIALAAAFSRAGHVAEAAGILAADKDFWQEAGAQRRRTHIAYLIVAAENEQRTGRIGEALQTTERARKLLAHCTGMTVARVRVERLRAACLTEWRQFASARRAQGTVHKQLAALQPPPPRRTGPGQPPPAAPTVELGRLAPTAGSVRPHGRLASETSSVAAQHGFSDVLRVPGAARAPVGDDDTLPVFSTIEAMEEHARCTALRPESVSILTAAVERLQGKAGLERVEARALVRVGLLLSRCGPELHGPAERVLRRAQVRLEHLDGMGLLLAQCQVALARVLREKPDLEAALKLGVEGLRGLDSERVHMHQRRYRDAWLSDAVDIPFAEVIDLALQPKGEGLAVDEDLAMDLIIFSRLAGVVVPQADSTGQAAEVPIAPVPTLSYIDGTVSKIEGSGVVRFE